MPGTRYTLEVRPTLPPAIARLDELAGNLIYSWDRRIRGLFYFMDPVLWDRCEHTPKVFLRRISQQRLNELAEDRGFLQQYADTLAAFDKYQTRQPGVLAERGIDVSRLQVAYFCMEYGLHESLRLYSGGLGILAGDHCKSASDVGLPFTAVGLMYRLGYFTQTIDASGEQEAHYQAVDFDDLPIVPARDAAGHEVIVHVSIASRTVAVRVWQLLVGHVKLYLLDTDVPENTSQDRAITYQLYGGDGGTRIAQEIVLGVGGVRALRALGLDPSVWHINEGHSAFLLLERCRELVASGMDFDTVWELVASATVFTTHTPVPAGHDIFSRDLMVQHFEKFADELRIDVARLLQLGTSPQNGDGFNMTALALRGSRHQNGVSRVHRQVASRMEGYVWPEVPAAENPMQYVNNGVHAPTFMARQWVTYFNATHPDWHEHVPDSGYWFQAVSNIPDQEFWSLRQSLKGEMLRDIRAILQTQYQRNSVSRSRTEDMLQALGDNRINTLIIGFARRFATYKRALLLFQDPVRLAKLLSDPERPIIVLFAGKAHPQDRPGQQIIKELNAYAQRPEFSGKLFFIEGHDIALERKLVTGVDLWLNTPEYPLEASGTSGQKGAINGVINLSILDGWWSEGYDGTNGWAIPPHDSTMDSAVRNRLEAEELLDILEREVVPTYYQRDASGMPPEWVKTSKRSMESILPRFNAHRMVFDYTRRFYLPALQHGQALAEDRGAGARRLAQWKTRVREAWPRVGMHWITPPPEQTRTGEPVTLAIAADLNGLQTSDVSLECCIESNNDGTTATAANFTPVGTHGANTLFKLELVPPVNGLMHLSVRLFPMHALLAHRFEMGLMTWL